MERRNSKRLVNRVGILNSGFDVTDKISAYSKKCTLGRSSR
jgi:hypothetical protein